MKEKLTINPDVIKSALKVVREALDGGITGELKMPSPFESYSVLLNKEPEKDSLLPIPITVPSELADKIKSIYVIPLSLDK
jgi:hypothetical protein